VRESELPGMQEEAVTRHPWSLELGSIETVAYYRATQLLQMYPYLMGPACMNYASQERKYIVGPKHFIFRDGFFAL